MPPQYFLIPQTLGYILPCRLAVSPPECSYGNVHDVGDPGHIPVPTLARPQVTFIVGDASAGATPVAG